MCGGVAPVWYGLVRFELIISIKFFFVPFHFLCVLTYNIRSFWFYSSSCQTGRWKYASIAKCATHRYGPLLLCSKVFYHDNFAGVFLTSVAIMRNAFSRFNYFVVVVVFYLLIFYLTAMVYHRQLVNDMMFKLIVSILFKSITFLVVFSLFSIQCLLLVR